MANPAHVKIVKKGAQSITNWRKKNPHFTLDLSRTDLSNADLSNADLSNADLSNADLSNADLSNADLSEAIFEVTNLSNANFSNANLQNANLRNANLRNANLRNANLRNANLTSANLTNANLESADLSNAKMSDVDLSGARWVRAILCGIDFSEANLSGANLSNANFSGGNLNGTDLSGATLGWANFCGVRMKNANLENANLTHAKMSGAKLIGANLSGTDLDGADLSRTHYWRTNLRNANLSRANLSRTDLGGADLRKADMSDVDLSEADLSWADLSGANLSNASSKETRWTDLDLSQSIGLESVIHRGRSSLGVDTLMKSNGKIPERFLRGCGLTDDFISYIPSHFANPAIDFYSCFISYSHEDKSFARRLHDALQGRGIRCWLDEHQLLPGDNIYDRVDHGIRVWDKVLLCTSKHSLTSGWVDDEIKHAFAKEKQLFKQRGREVLSLIPLNLDGYLFSEWQHPKCNQILERLAPDFTNWESDNTKFEVQFERVVKALQTNDSGRELDPIPKL
ncbi:toll/interleukin-1 receptor domain-containing protein [Gimesia aquarii]|uniref:Secreted effector protein pipB2 n=1 Tax=Gimesia aquarii TaxID=2527964 RepID=A0A517X1A9_9PLAN|nr:toll/interleukin-1 receptor domain-containing protein [Gimesia aquarii]QDU11295.1 Secreted effector protein pipB2 [Gimesia aquarii]